MSPPRTEPFWLPHNPYAQSGYSMPFTELQGPYTLFLAISDHKEHLWGCGGEYYHLHATDGTTKTQILLKLTEMVSH